MLKLVSALLLSTAFFVGPVWAHEKVHHPQKHEVVVPKHEEKVVVPDRDRHHHEHHWWTPWRR